MRKDNDIEKLFKHHLSNYTEIPPLESWDSISKKLDNTQDDKKRVFIFPLWLKASGIAASLMLGTYLLVNYMRDSNNSINNSIPNKEKTKQVNQSDLFKPYKNQSNSIVEKKDITIQRNSTTNNNTTNSKNSLTTTSNYTIITSNKLHKPENKTNFVANNNIVYSGKIKSKLNNKKQNIYLNKNKSNSDFWSSRDELYMNKFNSKNSIKSSNIENDNSSNTSVIHPNDLTYRSTNDKTFTATQSSNTHHLNDELSFQKRQPITGYLSILCQNIPNTTPLTNYEQLKEWADLITKKEEKKNIDKFSRWAVNTFVSPIIPSSFNNNSPISSEFQTNKKNYNNTLSYGAGITYQLSKKWAISSGISTINLDYDTENIVFYSSYKEQNDTRINIDRNEKGKNLFLQSYKKTSLNVYENYMMEKEQKDGTLNQILSFVEIPLHVSYNLLDKKMKVNLKGGLSTFILTENKVSIKADNGITEIGTASNVNNTNFSTNLGINLNYNLFSKLSINLDPQFQYQWNMYTSSNNFQPYFISVQTGVKYSF